MDEAAHVEPALLSLPAAKGSAQEVAGHRAYVCRSPAAAATGVAGRWRRTVAPAALSILPVRYSISGSGHVRSASRLTSVVRPA